MQQAEGEDHGRPPWRQPARQHVLDPDIDDRGRDQRLDDIAGDSDEPQRAEGEGDGMGEGEGGDLPQERGEPGGEKEQAEDERGCGRAPRGTIWSNPTPT